MNPVRIKLILLLLCLIKPGVTYSQTVSEKLTAAFTTFAADAQMRNGIASLYVIEAKTGKVVFRKNELIGLAPASTQKVITSVSAYELLGKEFNYQTHFAYRRNKEAVSLLITPSGDPTLGSWRWPQTKDVDVVKGLTQAIGKLGIKSIREIIINNRGWDAESIPDGWMWQDIGNYYGAGAARLNWHENQFDVILKSGKNIGDPVSIVKTIPELVGYKLQSALTAAATGTGDNAYIYFPLNAPTAVIRGTIPINQSAFKISGAIPAPAQQFISTLSDSLVKSGIKSPGQARVVNQNIPAAEEYTFFHSVKSPPLESLVFWFNRKSINLYGEALIKTIGFKKTGIATTSNGIEVIKDFWKQKGTPEPELNLVDGSGLSPLNRVTTHAQVSILQHAKNQPWFNGFYKSLPLYNGMKMKSGTIRGVKGFCGYHRSKDGQEYVFSFLVNNYHGSASAVVQKMYKVLDVLK